MELFIYGLMLGGFLVFLVLVAGHAKNDKIPPNKPGV